MKRCAPARSSGSPVGDGVGTTSEVAQHGGAGRHLRHRLAEGLTGGRPPVAHATRATPTAPAAMPCMAARLVTLPNARPHSAAGVNLPIRPPGATRIPSPSSTSSNTTVLLAEARMPRPSQSSSRRMPGRSAGSRNDTIRPSCSPPRMAAWEARWVATGDPVDRTLRPRSTLRPESSTLTSLRRVEEVRAGLGDGGAEPHLAGGDGASRSGARPARAVPTSCRGAWRARSPPSRPPRRPWPRRPSGRAARGPRLRRDPRARRRPPARWPAARR